MVSVVENAALSLSSSLKMLRLLCGDKCCCVCAASSVVTQNPTVFAGR
jgi:hypothetical protein